MSATEFHAGSLRSGSAHPLRIVLTTFGSLGDLHPYLALATGLQARGHSVALATQRSHEARVRDAGIEFAAVGPDIADFGDEAALMKRVMNRFRGPEFVMREMVMPHLRRAYDEMEKIVAGVDLLVTHPLAMAAQLLAEKNADRLRWVSVALAPVSFWSAYDPPVLPAMPWLERLHFLGPGFAGPLLTTMKWSVSWWVRPWHKLRAELGLPRTSRSPVFEAQFSPELTLAMFSPLLAKVQPDWPPHTRVTGFLFYDRVFPGAELSPELRAFLDNGEPPIIFTLGSSAVMDAGDFYAQSAEAALQLGRRAVLLIGRDPRNRPAGTLPGSILVSEYAPYGELFPRAAAIVHQGGIGTTAQALRAGKPMLVMPFGFDQHDNAARVARLGTGRTITKRRYRAGRVAAELRALLGDGGYAARARAAGETVRAENGLANACGAIEEQLARPLRRA